MSKILIVDDQKNVRSTIHMMLRTEGYHIEEAQDGELACQLLATGNFDLVITDLKMGSTDGMEVLRFTKSEVPLTEVIVMTAFGTIESAVEAMRAGASDYVQKPFEEEELVVKVHKALEKRRLAREVSVLAAEFRDRYHFENIIGRSQAVRDVLGRIVRISHADSTVLVTGESGTGKELVARAIHANSPRSGRPFISVNCAAISETLLESELFGHTKGAFTGATSSRKGLFEEASGGTFFLDEIGETSPSLQAKLLRALQEGEIRRLGENSSIHVDVRLIAATNQDLAQSIKDKTFREDLYYRLNVVRLHLPPLRERREDLPLLTEHFVAMFGKKMNRQVTLGEGVMEYFNRYAFPGNVRELQNLIEQGMALSVNGTLSLDDIISRDPYAETAPKSLRAVLDKAERDAISATLREVSGNRERAAEMLGLSATTLWRKMKRLELP